MQLSEIATALAKPDINTTTALVAFGLILVALVFKVGAAPFHLWIPDVYQGAPTPITAFLSVASKAAGFMVTLRLVSPFLASADLVGKVTLVLTVIAIITLLVGNLAALPQKNFKRLLAYSSIAHAGFLVMALASSPRAGGSSALTPAAVIAFYLGAYLLMTLLAFLVMTSLRTRITGEDLDSFRGLAKRSPFLAFAMLVAMASLAGIPLTAGFFGKLFVFKLAVESQHWALLTVGLIGAAAGFYYYLKIAASMFLSDPAKGQTDVSVIPVSTLARIVMIVLMVAIILAGFNPGVILRLFSY